MKTETHPTGVEIYNAGPDDVNLDGWHLTDDPASLQKWSFPAQDLSAGNFPAGTRVGQRPRHSQYSAAHQL